METKTKERPAILSEEHLVFLDELRESGATNMFGARSYLMEDFPGLTKAEAGDVLQYWMDTFGDRHPK